MQQEVLYYRLDAVRQVDFTLLMTVIAMIIQLSTRGTVDSDN